MTVSGRPITPDEVADILPSVIPEEVFNVFNKYHPYDILLWGHSPAAETTDLKPVKGGFESLCPHHYNAQVAQR